MLSPEEKDALERRIAEYPTRRAAAIEALVALQARRRWISDEALADVAELLGMNSHELDAVATFYNLIHRRPIGRHVILLCDSVSCWILGCEGLRAALEKKLGLRYGQTTADDRFTLLPIACLGTCDRAPALMIDEDTHRDLTPEALDEVLARYR